MARVFISIGSNIDPGINLPDSVRILREQFGELMLSPVYESEPVGFEGENFYNMVVGLDTNLEPEELVDSLHAIEGSFDRSRDTGSYSPRTIDLDLLLYNDLVLEGDRISVPREEILKYAFVLCPLADIVGSYTHPVNGRRYSDLWREFEKDDIMLRRVNLFD